MAVLLRLFLEPRSNKPGAQHRPGGGRASCGSGCCAAYACGRAGARGRRWRPMLSGRVSGRVWAWIKRRRFGAGTPC